MMSAAAGQNVNQIQQDIQHELITANQLLHRISMQLNSIKNFTSPGGELEATIKCNASLISTLANLQHINLHDVPPVVRRHIDKNPIPMNQNETHHTTQNESQMDHGE